VLQETCLAVFHKGGHDSKVVCSAQSVNGRISSTVLGRIAIDPVAADRPWVLPRLRGDRDLIGVAATRRRRLRDFGWRASTGPLVWNRHKRQIGREPDRDSVPIIWAADLETGYIRRSSARDHRRWIRLRPKDEFMQLSEPAILVQRTTAPEQPRRLVAAALTAKALIRDWGGVAVVENHVNVLRCASSDSPLTAKLLAALLNTPTYDRLFRCMTGTVAVSAYELEALAFPDPEVLQAWAALTGDELTDAVAKAFA
jgi:adenine-specific DNA-methyltransferase